MKFSEIKGERTLDVICELIEPICNIALDKDAADLFQTKARPKNQSVNDFVLSRIRTAYPALLKKHRADLIKIAAAVNDTTEEEYAANLTMKQLLDDITALMTDVYFRSFFVSVPTPGGSEASGDSAETTTDQKQ